MFFENYADIKSIIGIKILTTVNIENIVKVNANITSIIHLVEVYINHLN